MNAKLKRILEKEGYSHLREYGTSNGICGIRRMLFTTGLFCGLTQNFYEGRWCYPTMFDAVQALTKWDGRGDPPGNWIKYKGRVEYSNPNIEEEA